MIFRGINNEILQLAEGQESQKLGLDTKVQNALLFIWVREPGAKINYDGVVHVLEKNTIVSLTVFHELDFNDWEATRVIKFNPEFYCILEHDPEVGCKGLLFYGATQLPFFQIPDQELDKFENLWELLHMEIESNDQWQLSMLQMLLKRFIILCTRIHKKENNIDLFHPKENDMIREFNFLVEQHFKTKHSLQDYAILLSKSPKTLSNTFCRLSNKSPLQIIHERKLLEAKRMLRYTDKAIKEIAYDLGFEDTQAFSKFFKKMEKQSPSDFKNMF